MSCDSSGAKNIEFQCLEILCSEWIVLDDELQVHASALIMSVPDSPVLFGIAVMWKHGFEAKILFFCNSFNRAIPDTKFL